MEKIQVKFPLPSTLPCESITFFLGKVPKASFSTVASQTHREDMFYNLILFTPLDLASQG